jgi:hypothetical protein
MHKGIILLIKSTNKAGALTETRDFLKENGDVWDWYQIGGRWSGTLSPFTKSFYEKAKEILSPDKDEFILQSVVDAKQNELQQLWQSLGAEGPNPYSDHYHMDNDGNPYDVVPLNTCLPIVQEWQQTIEDAHEEKEKANRWLAIGGGKDKDGNPYDDWNMYGYCLKKVANLYQQNFFFDCNIFNTETYNYSIPEDIENYYAVMIDIHD